MRGVCSDTRRDDSGLELRVKRRGREETSEPYKNVVETVLLDKYQRLHGTVTVAVDTVDSP